MPIIGKGSRGSRRDLAVGADESGAKTDAGAVAFADAAKTHDESHGAVGHVGLIGVHDDAGVADRGGLERVLVREGGAEQQPTLFAQVLLRVESIAHALGVLTEDGHDVAVSSGESV